MSTDVVRLRSLFAVAAVEVLAAKAKAEGQDTDRDASNLRTYWTRGEGAEVIDWNTPGALDRCEQYLDGYPINPASLCRSYYKDVHGHNNYEQDDVKPEESGNG